MWTAELIKAARANETGRARDIAEKLGLAEAQLLAAEVGDTATALQAHPNVLIPMLEPIGTCMALTRNDACVIEKDGTYTDFHGGEHAAMTLNAEIDLRMFPRHWVHAFALEEETKDGTRRSVQVFDAAGDAIHKVYLRPGADLSAWSALQRDLALDHQADTLTLKARLPTEGPKIVEDKRDILLKEWKRLTDTHQFLRLCAKLKMNRLGAYRIAGAPFVRPIKPDTIPDLLNTVRDAGIAIMIFVGNRGCIEIHSGPIHKLVTMGPWENVLDPTFNLHLRQDLISEVWAVEKPTQRGAALSVEAFNAEGGLIFQMFPVAKETLDTRPEWADIVARLPELEVA